MRQSIGASRLAELGRRHRAAAKLREMLHEASAGREAAGLDCPDRIPWEHVQRRRIWARYPDRRTLTGRICGDPIIERSAWWPRQMEAAE